MFVLDWWGVDLKQMKDNDHLLSYGYMRSWSPICCVLLNFLHPHQQRSKLKRRSQIKLEDHNSFRQTIKHMDQGTLPLLFSCSHWFQCGWFVYVKRVCEFWVWIDDPFCMIIKYFTFVQWRSRLRLTWKSRDLLRENYLKPFFSRLQFKNDGIHFTIQKLGGNRIINYN